MLHSQPLGDTLPFSPKLQKKLFKILPCWLNLNGVRNGIKLHNISSKFQKFPQRAPTSLKNLPSALSSPISLSMAYRLGFFFLFYWPCYKMQDSTYDAFQYFLINSSTAWLRRCDRHLYIIDTCCSLHLLHPVQYTCRCSNPARSRQSQYHTCRLPYIEWQT